MKAFFPAMTLMFLCSCTTNNALLASSTLALSADWIQTRDIKNHPEYKESNPILGDYPSDARIDIYFASVVVINAVLGKTLSEKWANRYLASMTVLQMAVAGRNATMGLKVNF
jgi:hypothetical protein